jgi:hypothetical protein
MDRVGGSTSNVSVRRTTSGNRHGLPRKFVDTDTDIDVSVEWV